MNVLVVGEWRFDIYEQAVFDALRLLGHEVHGFGWRSYLEVAQQGGLGALNRLCGKIQNKLLFGPLILKINADLVAAVRECRPDMVFIFRGTHILPETLRIIRRVSPKSVIVSYNNDDPFSSRHPSSLWRHFVRSIPENDLCLVYRHHNISEFESAGAKRVKLLRSWYIPHQNHPVALDDDDASKYGCDVVFVGHFEPDGRLELLEAVVQRGYRLNLFGTGWNEAVSGSSILRKFSPVLSVRGAEYNKAICGGKIALCFLSKLNRDTYTRRCFEIPATGTMMLSEYTDDLASLFHEGIEADYFRSKDEFVGKLDLYLADDLRRVSVAQAGYRRLVADGHDVVARMKEVLSWIEEIRVSR